MICEREYLIISHKHINFTYFLWFSPSAVGVAVSCISRFCAYGRVKECCWRWWSTVRIKQQMVQRAACHALTFIQQRDFFISSQALSVFNSSAACLRVIIFFYSWVTRQRLRCRITVSIHHASLLFVKAAHLKSEALMWNISHSLPTHSTTYQPNNIKHTHIIRGVRKYQQTKYQHILWCDMYGFFEALYGSVLGLTRY